MLPRQSRPLPWLTQTKHNRLRRNEIAHGRGGSNNGRRDADCGNRAGSDGSCSRERRAGRIKSVQAAESRNEGTVWQRRLLKLGESRSALFNPRVARLRSLRPPILPFIQKRLLPCWGRQVPANRGTHLREHKECRNLSRARRKKAGITLPCRRRSLCPGDGTTFVGKVHHPQPP